MNDFLVLIEWLNMILGLIAAAAFGAMVSLVLVAIGVIQVKREP